ncbi:response regulator transcription factor [Gracilibacillus lacisalsi]|uniref:response regulator transcription factor n=1 Tax=Gracilibacillus lacisalsi TaxID=393087 RepID=UPI0003823999|nr:response regulator [Gracilibacillus lacisalsi]
MTLKMLIVDDEPLICQGLSDTVPWEEVGIDVVGAAPNGKKALEIMEKEKVDIVITDVYMPEMDGLHLSKAIVDCFPDVTIVMISGYEEFEYARQALRIGVQDYLLKPVDIDELMALVKRVKQQMQDTRKEEQVKQETLLTNYLTQQLFHLPDSYHLAERIQDQAYPFRLMLLETINYYKTDQSSLSSKHIKHVIDKYEVSSIFIETHENQLALFLYDDEEISDQAINHLTSAMMETLDNEVFIAISSSCHDLNQISVLYHELNKRLSFYRGTATKVVTDLEAIPPKKTYNVDKQLVVEISDAVFRQDKAEATKKADQLFTEVTQKQLTLEQIKKVFLDLLDSIKEKGQETTFEQQTFRLNKEIDLLIFNSVEALHALLLEDLEEMIDYLESSCDNHWIIQQAKQYIEKNYQKDIKAVEVAEAHYITPNYFSMLFKQETGYSYSEYLNTIRINKAKELLTETSNKVFEIAEYVGYREYKYFVQVFKNYVGITPTQFRRLHSIEK